MKNWEKFTRHEIEEIVKGSRSFRDLSTKLGYNPDSGSAINTIHSMIDELKLDISHFTGQGWNKNNFDYTRFKNGNAIKTSSATKAISYLRGYRCEKCGLSEWLDKDIPLEIHHKDGNSLNNELCNLELLCPNCHAFTDSYRGKNINNGIKIVPDDVLVDALRNNPNIRRALIQVGLTAKGDNYRRAREMIFLHSITHLM